MTDYKAEIQQLARANQFRMHPFALKRLSDFLVEINTDDASRRELLRDLFSLLQKQSATAATTKGSSSAGASAAPYADRFVDQQRMNDVIQQQLKRVRGAVEREGGPSVRVVPGADIPCVNVDLVTEELRIVRVAGEGAGSTPATTTTTTGSSSSSNSCVGPAANEVVALRQRYMLARRRCLRSGVYRKDLHASLVTEELLPLLPTSTLEGIRADQQVAVLGLLARREGELFLEDPRGRVQLVAASFPPPTDFFLGEGYVVVARGYYRNSALHLAGIDLPPAERREALRSDVGPSADLFGLAPPDLAAAELAGQQAVRSVILFLAHVHLDAPGTLQRLAFFFQRMQERSEEELADTTIVLIGNFFATPLREADASHLPDVLDDAEQLRLAFDSLAACIATHGPTVAQQAHLVLLPGPTDCTSLQGFLPQPTLVGDHLRTLRARVRRLSLAPNPARLRFCAHEMVVCRQEFLRGMQDGQRNLLDGLVGTAAAAAAAEDSTATATTTSFEKVVKTIVDEAHLAPDTSSSSSSSGATVLWRLDHHLRLPQLPHTLLLCDTTEPWECFYKGVRVVNPGSFAVNATFLWYTPADGECSLSRLDGA